MREKKEKEKKIEKKRKEKERKKQNEKKRGKKDLDSNERAEVRLFYWQRSLWQRNDIWLQSNVVRMMSPYS